MLNYKNARHSGKEVFKFRPPMLALLHPLLHWNHQDHSLPLLMILPFPFVIVKHLLPPKRHPHHLIAALKFHKSHLKKVKWIAIISRTTIVFQLGTLNKINLLLLVPYTLN